MSGDAFQDVLIRKAVDGDPAALTVLLAQTRDHLRNHMERRIPKDLRTTIDADDIVQEAQVEAFNHMARFVPGGPDSFYRWIATIAIRRLHNATAMQRALKRGGQRSPLVASATSESCVALLDLMAAPVDTPSRRVAGREAIQAMEQALAALPDDYRKAVRLVYLEGHSVTSAAKIMGRTTRAIHNLCYKAKTQLRKLMGSRSSFLSSSG